MFSFICFWIQQIDDTLFTITLFFYFLTISFIQSTAWQLAIPKDASNWIVSMSQFNSQLQFHLKRYYFHLLYRIIICFIYYFVYAWEVSMQNKKEYIAAFLKIPNQNLIESVNILSIFWNFTWSYRIEHIIVLGNLNEKFKTCLFKTSNKNTSVGKVLMNLYFAMCFSNLFLKLFIYF